MHIANGLLFWSTLDSTASVISISARLTLLWLPWLQLQRKLTCRQKRTGTFPWRVVEGSRRLPRDRPARWQSRLAPLPFVFVAWQVRKLTALLFRFCRPGKLSGSSVPSIGGTRQRWRSSAVDTAVASSATKVAADVYLAFLFWTTWTSLPAVVWYFPLWAMGLSGQEASVLLYNTAFLLTLSPIRRLVSQFLGVVCLLSLIGIGSYWVPEPQWRLLYAGLGVGGITLAWFAYFLGARRRGSQWEYIAWMLGLLLANVVKLANYSNNPAWTIMKPETGGWNRLAVLLAIAACVEMMMRKGTSPNGTWQKDPKKTDGYASSDGETVPTSPMIRTPDAGQPHWSLAGLGLGGVLFSLLAMATDSGTIARWSTEGYPHTGPQPILGGLITLAAMAAGLWIATDVRLRAIVLSDTTFAAATVGIFVLYFWHRWLGFLFGLVYVVWLFAAAPAIVEAAVGQRNIGRTFFTGTFLLNVLIVLAQWPVAYEFVPAGWLLRERTWVISACGQALMWCGVKAARAGWNERPSVVRSMTGGKETGTRTMLRSTLVVLGVLTALGAGWRVLTAHSVHPLRPDDRIITGGIWTIHFGIDNDAYSSHIRMEKLIRDLEVDVFGRLPANRVSRSGC